MVGFFYNKYLVISIICFIFAISFNTLIRKENLINLYNEQGQRHGYWEDYWDNGQLCYKGNYVNGEKHGYWERYHDNGKLWYKGNFVNGKRHGYWEWYYDNLWNKGHYVNGNRHGYWETYHYNGKLLVKGNYLNGKRHGYWKIYYDNGNVCYEGYFDMDKRVEYNPDEPKVIELTLSEIASKFGVDVNQLRIKE